LMSSDHDPKPYVTFGGPTLYRCTQGHEWSSTNALESFGMMISINVGTVTFDRLCTRCLANKLAQLLEGVGTVEVVDRAVQQHSGGCRCPRCQEG